MAGRVHITPSNVTTGVPNRRRRRRKKIIITTTKIIAIVTIMIICIAPCLSEARSALIVLIKQRGVLVASKWDMFLVPTAFLVSVSLPPSLS